MSSNPLFSVPETFYKRFERRDGPDWTTHYCPGCGHGNVHKFIAEAVRDFGVQDQSILVNPVGCAVFAYYYMDMGNVQVAHGRCSKRNPLIGHYTRSFRFNADNLSPFHREYRV